MTTVSEYVCQRLYKIHQVRHVFLITGGGAMHLNDAFGKSHIHVTCHHHEQACAIAAEGYARASGKIGVVNVTTGPGGTNAITGVIGAWLDSIPMLIISGQVKQTTCVSHYPEIGLRQIGDQEIGIIPIVKSVTKYAVSLTAPNQIQHVLDEAVYLATTGRPGPVWIEIPLDIQAASIEELALPEFYPPEIEEAPLPPELNQMRTALAVSKRPLIVAGHGIRLARAKSDLWHVLDQTGIPVVTTFNGMDLVPDEHPRFSGRIGTLGTRAGNFALQNADVLLFIGTRNNIRQISYNWEHTARSATNIIVDIDPAELNKPTFEPDIPIAMDAGGFLRYFIQMWPDFEKQNLDDWQTWQAWCRKGYTEFPVLSKSTQASNTRINPYHFMSELTQKPIPNTLVVAGNGTACVALYQAGKVHPESRIFWNSGCAAMGYDLPASIGASLSSPDMRVLCLAGDGSLMMNVQELATLAHNRLPITVYILNNNGYISIRQTQHNFFQGRLLGCDPESGVGFPDFQKLSAAFGIDYLRIETPADLARDLPKTWCHTGPLICEIMLETDYVFSPKTSSKKLADGSMVSAPLEDMYPFLERRIFNAHMIVDTLDDNPN